MLLGNTAGDHPVDIAEEDGSEVKEESNNSDYKRAQSTQELGVSGLTHAEEEKFKKEHPASE